MQIKPMGGTPGLHLHSTSISVPTRVMALSLESLQGHFIVIPIRFSALFVPKLLKKVS